MERNQGLLLTISNIHTDKLMTMNVEKKETLEGLKVLIEAECAIPVDAQMLYLYGKLLKDDKKLLSKLGVKNGDILTLAQRAGLSLQALEEQLEQQLLE